MLRHRADGGERRRRRSIAPPRSSARGTSLLLVAPVLAARSGCGVRSKRSSAATAGAPSSRLGLRNAADRPGRSVLAIGVIASATFILISVDAFHSDGAVGDRSPLRRRRLSAARRSCCCRSPPIRTAAKGATRSGSATPPSIDVSIEPFRVLPGDDASCLNLYEPRNPRILGARRAFIDAGRFALRGHRWRRPTPSARIRGCCCNRAITAGDETRCP